MTHARNSVLAALVISSACTAVATPSTPAPARAATSPISATGLRTRLFAYADDSMRGREAGTADNQRATAWIANEARRIGLQPAGDNGTFFQDVPLFRRELVGGASISVDGQTLGLWTDFAAIDVQAAARPIDHARVVFAGRLTDTASMIPPAAGAGKFVVVRAMPGMPIFAAYGLVARRYPGAAAVAFANQDAIVEQAARFFRSGQVSLRAEPAAPQASQPTLLILGTRASTLLVGDADKTAPGTGSKTVRGNIGFAETAAPARNVVAILPGTDAALRGQYVALGSHNDHVGVRTTPVDHDSLRAFNAALHALGANDPFSPVAPDRRAAIRVNVDSLRAIRPVRRDSIHNGADDDGSGTVGMLAIAEAWIAAEGADRPRRSVLFVWHTAEELGLFGSEYFTDHPTVPRDSIVAQVNIDMIGRGGASDVTGGGPRYVELIGPKRLSTDYVNLINAVNAARPTPFVFDLALDADGHPENIYCRSDHASYARYGIPVAFFSTGTHLDYHQVTDEPQYIDYDHYRSVVHLVYDVTRAVANRSARLVVDKPKPDPKAPCRQ